MLFINVSGPVEIVQICISALLGIFGIAAALNGFYIRRIPVVLRIVLLISGLCMVFPGTITDVFGLMLLIAITVFQRIMAKKEAQAPAV